MSGDFNNDFNNDFSGASGGAVPLVVYQFTNPPPSSGGYVLGQIAVNSNPAPDEPLVWMNFSSTSTPNWVSMLNKSAIVLSAIGSAVSAINSEIIDNTSADITPAELRNILLSLTTVLSDIETSV